MILTDFKTNLRQFETIWDNFGGNLGDDLGDDFGDNLEDNFDLILRPIFDQFWD
jgi:hypothetical protein